VKQEIDYTKHTETELVEMFGRMDPRYAPANCARLYLPRLFAQIPKAKAVEDFEALLPFSN
jgi:hypothetical protein